VKLPALVLGIALCAMPALAAEYELGDAHFELRGSVKTIYTYTRATMTDDVIDDLAAADPNDTGTTRKSSWGLLTRGRFIGEGVWQDRVYGQFIYDHELRKGTSLETIGFETIQELGAQTWLNWDRSYSQNGTASNWRHLIYRAWVRWQEEGFDVTVGRQRIALGRGRLWNPEDLFNPIFPLAVEGDQRIGQDAAVGRVRLPGGLWASAIVSPQDEYADWRSAVRLDYEHVGLDAGLMFGNFKGDKVFGADFASNLAGAAIRGEATYTTIRDRDNIWQTVLSVDYNFDVGNGIYGLVEYLYNENTFDQLDIETPLPPFNASRVIRALGRSQLSVLDRITTVRKHQLGVQTTYQFSQLLGGAFLVLYDWDGRSAAIAPSLTYSISDNVDLNVAGQLFVGKAESRNDYGDTPGLLIVQLQAYF
jgi:hypothetical protein